MNSALAPAWWVTRWLARSVATLAMTAFTALALALGAGSPALPAAAALSAPDPASVVQPARLTVADAAAVELGTERAGIEIDNERGAILGSAAPIGQPEPVIRVAVAAVPVAELAGATAAGPVGERAPPGR